MCRIWNKRGIFAVIEQGLVDQVRRIKVKGWLTDAEIEETRERNKLNPCGREMIGRRDIMNEKGLESCQRA